MPMGIKSDAQDQISSSTGLLALTSICFQVCLVGGESEGHALSHNMDQVALATS